MYIENGNTGTAAVGEATSVDATESQPDVSTSTVTGASSAPSPEALTAASENATAGDGTVFYDASKVPPELQASYRSMQAALTKKFEEVAAWRRLEEFGAPPDEVYDFISGLRTQDGLLNFWYEVGDSLGIPRDSVAALLNGEASSQPQQAPTSQGAEPQYMTKQEFDTWQRDMERASREREEDESLTRLLTEHSVNDQNRPYVLRAIAATPRHLPLEERVKAGVAEFQRLLDEHATQVADAARQKREGAPAPLGGGTPHVREDGEPAKDFKEARQRAMRRLSNTPLVT